MELVLLKEILSTLVEVESSILRLLRERDKSLQLQVTAKTG
jgi:hypothetical protein